MEPILLKLGVPDRRPEGKYAGYIYLDAPQL